MVSRRAVTALLFALVPCALFAQQSAEFGRSTGGEVVLAPKGSAPLSGSLELSLRGGSPAYGMTAGGTLLQDRLWFFASGSRQQGSRAPYGAIELPANAATRAIGGRVHGQIASRHDFSAFFDAAKRPELSTIGTSSYAGNVPSSFLSLRYTGIISSNMFFNASVTRSARTMNGLGFVPVE